MISDFCGNKVTGQILLCVGRGGAIFIIFKKNKFHLKLKGNKDLIFFPFKFKDTMNSTTNPLMDHNLQVKSPWRQIRNRNRNSGGKEESNSSPMSPVSQWEGRANLQLRPRRDAQKCLKSWKLLKEDTGKYSLQRTSRFPLKQEESKHSR